MPQLKKFRLKPLKNIVFSSFLAIFALFGTAHAEIRVTDIAGRQVKIEKPASHLMIDDGRYLIALSLLTKNPVDLLTAWPKDIARIGPVLYKHYEEKFPAIKSLAVVPSSAKNFSTEIVIAAHPDLVVLSLESKPSDADIATLNAAGIPVAIIDFFDNPLDNLSPSLRILGQLTGHEKEAESFITFRQKRLDEIKARLAGLETKPTVFLEPHAARTDDCCMSVGKGNVGKYIDFAGGHNIGDDAIAGPRGPLNPEYILKTDPDIYIATGGAHMEGTNGLLIGPQYSEDTIQETLARVASRPLIANLTAVKNSRVYGLAHQLLNSPLDIITIEALASWIHPELFPDDGAEETRKEINERFLPVPLEGTYWTQLKR